MGTKKKIAFDAENLEVLPTGSVINNGDLVVITTKRSGKSTQYVIKYSDLKTSVLNDLLLSKGTVTQGTNISTAVTINKPTGVITTVSLSASAGSVAGTFTVNNSFVTSSSIVIVSVEYASSATATPSIIVQDVTNGSFKIKVRNQSASGNLNAVAKIHFTVLS